MPLKAIPTYSIPEHMDEAPTFVFVLWGIGGVSTMITCFFVLRWLFRDAMASHNMMHEEGYVVVPMSVNYVRTIVTAPLWISALAYATLFAPGVGYFVNLTINIIAAVVLGALVNYFLVVLGEGETTKRVIAKFRPRRWFCGTCCGGFAEPLCCLGRWPFREERPLERWNVRLAFVMVAIWTFCFIFEAVWKFNTTQYFTTTLVNPTEDSEWCHTTKALPTTTTVISVLSGVMSFVGLSGLGMLAGFASLAVGEDFNSRKPLKFNAKKKAESATVYLFLLLWNEIISHVPLEFRNPVVRIPILVGSGDLNKTLDMLHPWHTSQTWLNGTAAVDDVVLAAYTYIDCPIYDKPVCSFMVYCTVISVFMAVTSFNNSRLYPPADQTGVKMREAILCGEMRSSAELESEDSDEEAGETGGETDDDATVPAAAGQL